MIDCDNCNSKIVFYEPQEEEHDDLDFNHYEPIKLESDNCHEISWIARVERVVVAAVGDQ